MDYVDPGLPRRLDGWHSPALALDMPIVCYGFRGRPLLLFPTAAADYLENERFYLVKAIEPALAAGQVRVFSIDTVNRHSWMDPTVPVEEQARRQALYSRYVEDEVVPYVRHICADHHVRLAAAGASFGAFHAANALFRRPDLFEALLGMSGFYDLEPGYLKGYGDDNCYQNNPAWYLRDVGGGRLHLLQTACRIVLVTGQGAYEHPAASQHLAGILGARGIPHALELWGHDVNHDWPWWRKMLPHYLDRL
ncbi:MAG: esterase family protein [Vicinamibacterales bacterium]